VAVRVNSTGKSQKTLLEFVIREAWRACAAAQGFFETNHLAYGLGRRVRFGYPDREAEGRGFACVNWIQAQRTPRPAKELP